MKIVKMLQHAAGPYGNLAVGDVCAIPDHVAEALIEAHAAELVVQEAPAVETAMAEPEIKAEKSVAPRQSKGPRKHK